jgi:hypothetical protein
MVKWVGDGKIEPRGPPPIFASYRHPIIPPDVGELSNESRGLLVGEIKVRDRVM